MNLINSRPVPLLTKRLWIFLLKKIGIDKEKKWADLLADERDKMINTLMRDKYIISGKGPFGEEFVTSGGVKINEVNFKSCLLYTSPSPRDKRQSRMPSSA